MFRTIVVLFVLFLIGINELSYTVAEEVDELDDSFDGGECVEISDTLTSFDICYIREFEASSSAVLDPTDPLGSYGAYNDFATYAIYSTLNTSMNLFNITMERAGKKYFETEVDETECISLAVDGIECISCSDCGIDKGNYSADCTNLQYGRKVDCESKSPLVFPLYENATLVEENVDDSRVECTTISDNVTLFDVCYIDDSYAISSISQGLNDTSEPYADFAAYYNFAIFNNDSDTSLNIFNITMERSGKIYVETEVDETECVALVVDGIECASCTYCGNDDRFSADCTNVPYGRNVDCEPAFPLFFPLYENATTMDEDDVDDSLVECATISDNVTVFDVCFLDDSYVSFSQGENDTSEPYGDFAAYYTFAIYNNDSDASLNLFNITMERSGKIYENNDQTECFDLFVDRIKCNSCSYCGGNERFSADCTNVPNGRKVECESVYPLFFPLYANATNKEDASPSVGAVTAFVQGLLEKFKFIVSIIAMKGRS